MLTNNQLILHNVGITAPVQGKVRSAFLLDGTTSYGESIETFRQTVDLERRLLGPNHPDTVDTVYSLARVLALAGKSKEAIATLRDAVIQGLSPEDLADLGKNADWNSLRGDVRFKAIIEQVKQRDAVVPKTN